MTNGTNRPLLRSGQLTALSPMLEEDQQFFQRWLAENEELRKLVGNLDIPTMEDQMTWFKRVQEPDRAFYSIVTLDNGVLIGNAGFVDIDSVLRMAEIRITLGHPDTWGKGYGTEAMRLMLQEATQRGYAMVYLFVFDDNLRAIRAYEKVGFVEAGERMDPKGMGRQLRMEYSLLSA